MKAAGQEFSHGSENTTCSVCKAYMRIRRKEKGLKRQQRKSVEGEGTEEEGIQQQQQRVVILARMLVNFKAEARMNAQNSWWVCELLVADCLKRMAPSRIGACDAVVVQLAARQEAMERWFAGAGRVGGRCCTHAKM